MKCLKHDCDRERCDAGVCPGCKMLLYCSQECCEAYRRVHSEQCGQKMRLEDFLDVKRGKESKVLGKGSYGEVKLVIHRPTSTYFALKTVSKEQATNAAQLAVLRREITVHKDLAHPNVVQLQAYFEDNENFYLLLEYAEKGNLYREVRRTRGLTEVKTKNYFTQVCKGIQYLHEKLVVHRDIKPENLVLTAKEEVKICDFGWCVEGLEMRSTFCGTVDYMAPEMLRGGGHSFAVDVWALGVLLYEMIHGVAPWTATKDKEKASQILNLRYTCKEGINPLIKDLIAYIFNPDPDNRPSVSQIFLHPWMREAPPIQLGDVVTYYLKGFGMSEGLVTDLERDECTLFFEVNGSYQKVPLAKLLSVRKDRDRPPPPRAEPEVPPLAAVEPVLPAEDPPGQVDEPAPPFELPLQLKPEYEAEVMDKLNKWCQQPPPPAEPQRDNPLLRELNESKRRLESSLAELQQKGHANVIPKSQFDEELMMEKKEIKLPSFLMDPEPEEGKAEEQKRAVKKKKKSAAVRKPRSEEASPTPVPQPVAPQELEEKLAKHQEELFKITQELDMPNLPKVKKKKDGSGLIGWFGGLFK